jgi:syntaxin 1B/2/3
MSRDRLADLRAQKGGGSDSDLLLSDYSTPAQRHPSGRPPNPYAQRDDQYEMSNVGGPVANAQRGEEALAFGGDMSQFYQEIGAIRDAIEQYKENARHAQALQPRVLNNVDDDPAPAQELKALTAEMSELGNKIKQRIKYLRAHVGWGPDGAVRAKQTQSVKDSFKQVLESYQLAENDHRKKARAKLERQYKIVKPEATEEEVKAAVDGEGQGQIFSQALLSSNRLGESRAAYKDVQQRHEDIKNIERTLEELVDLIAEVSGLVEAQDEPFHAIHDNLEGAHKNIADGVDATTKAVASAIAYRKKRWICFFLLLVILVIVAIVLATQLPPLIRKNNSNNNSGSDAITRTVTRLGTSIAASPTA